jgi:hypothetical protein
MECRKRDIAYPVQQSNSRFERGFSEGPSSYDGDEMASRNGEDAGGFG